MAQTKEGAALIAAKKAGMSLERYKYHLSLGLKRCSYCKAWLVKALFCKDTTRYDGLNTGCNDCRKKEYRKRYIPKPRPARGRRFVLPRQNDKKQARWRINYLIEAGLLDNPNNVPCIDCGHLDKSDKKRHEYDHYLGYGSDNHEAVEVVCSSCHHIRARGKKNDK